jgi:hypothetical protein
MTMTPGPKLSKAEKRMPSSGPSSKAVLVLFILLSVAAGCSSAAKYPVHKSSVLNTKIRIQMPEPYQFKSEDEFISDVLYGRDLLFDDDLARLKAVQFIRNHYKREFSEKPVDPNQLFEGALYNALTNYGAYLTLRTDGPAAYAHLSGISTQWSADSGRSVVTIESVAFAGGHRNSGKTDIFLDFTRRMSGGIATFEISGISYEIDCISSKNSSPQVGCQSKRDIEIDDAALLEVLKNLRPTLVHLPSVADLRHELALNRKHRYYRASAILHPNSITRTYPIDVAAAKARIESELDIFTFDGNKSTFVHEITYANPAQEKMTVTHRHWLILSPGNNGTAVQMSGEYSFLRDSYGGADKYGSEDFEAERARYMALIDELLQ